MEEKKSILTTLNSIDFDEWINIPKPLLFTLDIFKQCFVEQTKKISDVYVELNKFTEKIQYKMRSLNEVVVNTSESIQNSQESILSKVKERCEFLRNDFNSFKAKLSEENMNKQEQINESLNEMTGKIDKCLKSVSSVLTSEELNKLITEKLASLNSSVCSEVKELIVKPSIEKIITDIKAITQKHSKTTENITQLIKNSEKKSSEETSKIIKKIYEFQTHQIEKNSEFQSNFSRIENQINEGVFKIDSFYLKTADLDKSFFSEIGNINKEVQNTNERINRIISRIDSIKTDQRIFTSTTEIETSRLKSPRSSPKVKAKTKIKTEVPDFSKIIKEETSLVKTQIEASLKEAKKDIMEYLQSQVRLIEDKLVRSKDSFEQANTDLRDKLAWLPLNLSELKGMPANDARLFTIEARLRAEENSRIKAFSTIEKSIEVLRKHAASPGVYRSPNRHTPDPKQSERLIRFTDRSKDRQLSFQMDGATFESLDSRRRSRKSRSKMAS